MISVFVEALEFYGYHGVTPEETRLGHRFTLDLEMLVDSGAEDSDDVADTVDYGLAARLVLDMATAEPCKTLERLGAKLGDHILENCRRVHQVRLTIRKVLPPVPIIAGAVGVTIERSRRT